MIPTNRSPYTFTCRICGLPGEAAKYDDTQNNRHDNCHRVIVERLSTRILVLETVVDVLLSGMTGLAANPGEMPVTIETLEGIARNAEEMWHK